MERRYRKSRTYWAKHRVAGTGPPYLKISPKVILYDPADVDRWLASKRRTSTSDGDDHAPKPRHITKKPGTKSHRRTTRGDQSAAPTPGE